MGCGFSKTNVDELITTKQNSNNLNSNSTRRKKNATFVEKTLESEIKSQSPDDKLKMGSNESKTCRTTKENRKNPQENDSSSDMETKNNESTLKIPDKSEGMLPAHTEASASQVNFFKMLDEKIENGLEFDEAQEDKIRREKLQQTIKEWDLVLGKSLEKQNSKSDSSDAINVVVTTNENTTQSTNSKPTNNDSESFDESGTVIQQVHCS